MEHLGTFLMEYPNMFLKDQFIKYVGWMLHDKVSRPHRPSSLKAENRSRYQTTRLISRVRVCSTGCASEGGVCSGPGRPVRPRGEHAQAGELHPALPQEATGALA
jgi:hypothetical protein